MSRSSTWRAAADRGGSAHRSRGPFSRLLAGRQAAGKWPRRRLRRWSGQPRTGDRWVPRCPWIIGSCSGWTSPRIAGRSPRPTRTAPSRCGMWNRSHPSAPRCRVRGIWWVNARIRVPDGQHLYAVYENGRAFRWEVDPAAWRSRACTITGGGLTPSSGRRSCLNRTTSPPAQPADGRSADRDSS